jgi:MSHA biogenesis protein MshN
VSLINRMLRDLSSRQPTPNVMGGIQISSTPPRRRGAARLVLFLVLIAGFTAALWALFGRRPGAPPVAAVPPVPTVAPGLIEAYRFQLDHTLTTPSASPARPPARRSTPSPQPAAPPALTLESELETRAAPPATPRPAARGPQPSARDTRQAAVRHADAAAALSRGERPTAEAGFREALALGALHHEAREALAVLLMDQGRHGEAGTLLDEGLVLAPARAAFLRLAARVDLARGDAASAVTRLEPAPPPIANDPEYHGLLASAYQRVGRHEDAARVYQRLLQVQPAVAQWWAGYGLSRDALGDAPAALNAYAQARQLGRLDPRVLEYIDRRTAALQAPG